MIGELKCVGVDDGLGVEIGAGPGRFAWQSGGEDGPADDRGDADGAGRGPEERDRLAGADGGQPARSRACRAEPPRRSPTPNGRGSTSRPRRARGGLARWHASVRYAPSPACASRSGCRERRAGRRRSAAPRIRRTRPSPRRISRRHRRAEWQSRPIGRAGGALLVPSATLRDVGKVRPRLASPGRLGKADRKRRQRRSDADLSRRGTTRDVTRPSLGDRSGNFEHPGRRLRFRAPDGRPGAAGATAIVPEAGVGRARSVGDD